MSCRLWERASSSAVSAEHVSVLDLVPQGFTRCFYPYHMLSLQLPGRVLTYLSPSCADERLLGPQDSRVESRQDTVRLTFLVLRLFADLPMVSVNPGICACFL